MKITLATPRKHTLNRTVLNDEVTIYNQTGKDGAFGEGHRLRCYSEWSRAALERKYGSGCGYKALLIFDSTEPFTEDPGECTAVNRAFTVKVGDKVAPFQTFKSLKELMNNKEKVYTVAEVNTYTMRGALLTVEVLCG